jgi:hypothetical protein
LIGLPFNPEDVGDTFFRYIGWLSPDYMALHPRKYNSSLTILIEVFRDMSPVKVCEPSGVADHLIILCSLFVIRRFWCLDTLLKWDGPSNGRGDSQ